MLRPAVQTCSVIAPDWSTSRIPICPKRTETIDETHEGRRLPDNLSSGTPPRHTPAKPFCSTYRHDPGCHGGLFTIEISADGIVRPALARGLRTSLDFDGNRADPASTYYACLIETGRA